MKTKQKIVIAGGTGFVGRALAKQLTDDDLDVIALGRSEPSNEYPWEIKKCDLFSLQETETALQEANMAIYLVHSMLPNDRLTQGDFADFDLICADNFAQALKKNKIKDVIYLGGLMPDRKETLSQHLRSRKEVEDVFINSGLTLTTVRAGLIIGSGGSSYRILQKLVKRLPIMITPAWTSNISQPVALADATSFISELVSSKAKRGQSYNIGVPEKLNYKEMMVEYAEAIGKSLTVLTVPVNSYFLSKMWVRIFSGTKFYLVSPLIESMKHNMVAENNAIESKAMNFKTAVLQAEEEKTLKPRAETSQKKSPVQYNTVKSLQRMNKPERWCARKIAIRYANWLNASFNPIIKSKYDKNNDIITFSLFGINLLVLAMDKVCSNEKIARFLIKDGVLVKKKSEKQGFLEFRCILNANTILVGIFDFIPSLPWPVYTVSQAYAHLFVMNLFANYLAKRAKKV